MPTFGANHVNTKVDALAKKIDEILQILRELKDVIAPEPLLEAPDKVRICLDFVEKSNASSAKLADLLIKMGCLP